MADLFKKKNAELAEAPIAADANAPEAAPAAKKKAKKSKVQYLEPNKMNFFEQYEIVVEGKKKNLDLAKIMKPLIAVAVVVLAIFVVCEVVLLGFKAQTKSLEKYINDKDNVAAYDEAVATKAKIDEVNAQKANVESCLNAIKSYPNVNTDFFTKIANAASANGVTVSNYGYSNTNGFLSLTCSATTTDGISNFYRDLEALELFDSIAYTGFNGNEEGGYAFTLSIVCLGSEVEG